MFGFQQLDVYRASTRFLGLSSALVTRIQRGHSDLIDQFRRAALSVPLNIAEGSGKFNQDALRFYAIARGSALECAAILDAMEALELVDGMSLIEPREVLARVVSMLTRMLRS
jgi:four helix bundle protein